MKFRFYIIHEEGDVTGTDDADIATAYKLNDEYCVIDSQEGKFFVGDLQEQFVEEAVDPDDEEDEDNEG